MATERRTGAGGHLAGVLERATPPRPVVPPDPVAPAEDTDPAEGEATTTPKGRGAGRKATPPAKAPKKPKGRTIYLPDDLFERIIVQAHRRDKTISEYVTMILERQVPDHRTIKADPADEAGAA